MFYKVGTMYKTYRGKRSREFGEYEWAASVNWASLINALLVAFLGWFAAEGIPVLQAHGVLSSGALGAIAMAIPMIVNWLKDNSNKSIDKPIPSKK